MDNLYNSVFETYSQKFSGLPTKYQFHFASRMYLWQQIPLSKAWLERLRPEFTADNNPELALKKLQEKLVAERPTSGKWPELVIYERLLFRALFMTTIYGLDGRQALLKLVSTKKLRILNDRLLADWLELVDRSSTSINFLYIFERFVEKDEDSLANLPARASSYCDTSGIMQLRRWAYLLTHTIIGESLFYSRKIDEAKQLEFKKLLAKLEPRLIKHQSELTLDCLFEFLVCCKLVNYPAKLRVRPLLTANGFITEPLRTGPQSLAISEHRNVLFLMSQSAPSSSRPASRLARSNASNS